MDYDDILQSSRRKQAGIQTKFSNVDTSCSPVAHSNKAAKHTREKYLALWSYFGRPSLFYLHTM